MGFLTKKKNSKEIVKDEASTFASVPRSVARRRHRRSVLPRRVYRVDEKVGSGPLDLPIFGPYTYISMSSRFIISYRLYLSLNLISEGRKEEGSFIDLDVKMADVAQKRSWNYVFICQNATFIDAYIYPFLIYTYKHNRH